MRSYAHDGLVFEVKDEGPEDGFPVLFLHGFPQDSTSWDGVVEPLHRLGFRTLAPNLRGFSPGARPKRVKQYVLAKLVADAIALLDAAEVQQAHVVGHDWGGYVTWALASAHPDRVRTVTILSTPHPGAMRAAALRSRQLFRSWYMSLIQIPWLSDQLLEPPAGPGWRALVRGLPPHQAQHYAERLRQPGALPAALNLYRALPRDVIRPSLKIRRVAVPTLYLWGERDPALGRFAAEATAEFVTGEYRFTILPGVGHWLPERVPEVVVDAVTDFWATY